MKKIFLLSIIFCFAFPGLQLSFGQTKNERSVLTGNLFADSKIMLKKFNGENLTTKFDLPEKKSPVKAGLFSLLVPGAGQFYNENYIISAIFVAAEAALITTAVIYNNKGNRKTDEFQKFADQHWNVKTYAQWTLNNLKNLNSSLNANDYHVFDSNGNVVWQELNRLETDIGDGYSHNLPLPGEQQYYELIGKYPQYSHGWDDSNQNDTDFHILSPRFNYYSGQRGEANNLYNVSTKAVVGIYLNHVISALEAVWGASRFNNNLSMKMRIETINLAGRSEYVPTMNLKFNF